MTTNAFSYGSPVRINGQSGQVISRGGGPVVVETRNASGRSTGTTTLTGYDMAARRQLDSFAPGRTPSFVMPGRGGRYPGE